MIAGGLVAKYGLRACPLHCAGRCQVAREGEGGRLSHYDGRGKPFGVCQLMNGPAPRAGEVPSLEYHSLEQLRAMAQPGHGADLDVCDAARAEMQRRGGWPT